MTWPDASPKKAECFVIVIIRFNKKTKIHSSFFFSLSIYLSHLTPHTPLLVFFLSLPPTSPLLTMTILNDTLSSSLGEGLVLTSIAAALVAIVYLRRKLRIVPHGRSALIENWGRFTRVVGAGLYFLKIGEQFRRVRWSWNEETPQGTVVRRTSVEDTFQTENVRLDLAPMEGLTRDGIMFTVNGTILYRFTDLQQAVYHISDVMAHLEDCAHQAIRQVVSQRDMDGMFGHDDEVAAAICVQINQRLTDRGLACTSFLVQTITTDRRIARARTNAFVNARKIETNRQRIEAEQEQYMTTQHNRRIREEFEAQEKLRRQQEAATLQRQTQDALRAEKQAQFEHSLRQKKAKSQQEVALATQQAESRRQIEAEQAAHALKIDRDKKAAQLQYEAEQNRLEIEKERQLAQVEIEKDRQLAQVEEASQKAAVASYLEAGVDAEHYTRIRMAEAWSDGLKTTNDSASTRVVYMPTDMIGAVSSWWQMRQMPPATMVSPYLGAGGGGPVAGDDADEGDL